MSKQRLEQKKYQNLSPQQIQFLGLLQIPILSLEKRVEEEIEENPALEEEEEDVDKNINLSKGSAFQQNFEDFQIEDISNSIEDHLSKQLIDLSLSDDTLFLVKYLINSLDDNGFLSRDLYSISSDLLTNNNKEVDEKELKIALKILQSLEPIGVGVKNLKESILLQLQKLHPSEKIAFKIISDYYTSFSNKNYEHLTKNIGITEKKLKTIYKLIKKLSPFPTSGFSKNPRSSEYIYADFTITINNNELQLNLNKVNAKRLKVSKYYTNLLLETTDEYTKEFLTQKVEKAKWFKDSMEKREATLKRVMGAIIELQKDYLISGVESDLKPMKLANVAEIIKMDISTISRVSNSKYIEMHFGTFKVKELFTDAFRKDNGELISTNEIKHKLKEIIQNEDKMQPLKDEKLSELLGEEEYHIARRTVAKYREQLGIKTAKLRREL
jgi:RNA polymerase sigma-54 factor